MRILKIIKESKIAWGIILLVVLMPMVATGLTMTPSKLENFEDDNDWIGFFGSYTGAIASGLITLFVMDQTIKNGNENLKDSIDANKRIALSNDIATIIADYCAKSRKQRHQNHIVNICKNSVKEWSIQVEERNLELEVCESVCGVNYKENPSYIKAQKQFNNAQERFNNTVEMENNELGKLNNIDTISLQFLLKIKLSNINSSNLLLNKIENIDDIKFREDISDDVFDSHIKDLLSETTKFINEYSSIK